MKSICVVLVYYTCIYFGYQIKPATARNINFLHTYTHVYEIHSRKVNSHFSFQFGLSMCSMEAPSFTYEIYKGFVKTTENNNNFEQNIRQNAA